MSSAARALAGELASKLAPVSVAVIRRSLVALAADGDPEAAFAVDRQTIPYAFGSADAREGIMSFLEKRPRSSPALRARKSRDFLASRPLMVAERRADVTVVRWYERREGCIDIVARWLAAADRHLPEAGRSGSGTVSRCGAIRHRRSLADYYRQTDTLLFLQCRPPVMDAALAAPTVPTFYGRTACIR